MNDLNKNIEKDQRSISIKKNTLALIDLCESITDCHHSTPVYIENGYLVIRNYNIKSGRLHLSNVSYTTKETFQKRIARSKPEAGDLIITREAPMGEVCTIPKGIECCLGQRMVLIKPDKKKVDNQYLLYVLLSQYAQRQIKQSEGTGSIVSNLRIPLLKKIKIPYFDLQIQQKIGLALSALDAKIELNNRINAELEAMAKTLYDYWFVQFDFPAPAPSGRAGEGLPYKSSGGKMVWSEELKREIPEGWEVGVAADLFNFNPSSSLKSGSIASNIDMDALPTEGFMTKEVQKKQFKGGVKFQNGDLIVSRITPCLENGKTGLITLLDDNEIGFGSTEFIVLRGKMKALSSFAACLSRSELFRKYAIANMTGTSGRKRVEAKALEKFPLVIPEQEILDQFEEIVSPYFRIATIHTKQNQTLAALRDWLLPMLMNGQVRVEAIEEKVLAMAAEPAVEYKEG